ncbi:flavin reductase family protein [candidate division KSB1 bacterium]|nr:flavin reductase family protein [candidate division KSB1 bacterium]
MKQVTFKEAMELWSTPERVVFITAVDSQGNHHIMTVGWKMRASFRPPMIAVAIGNQRRMRQMIDDSKEFVVAVPGTDLAREVLICGMPNLENEDRFAKCGFSRKPGTFVKAPLVERALCSFECKLSARVETGDHTLFIGEVVASWVNEEPKPNLLVVAAEPGYQVLAEDGPYKIGKVRS